MHIKINVPGVYNDQNLEAHTCNAGDVLETRAWYGQELIRIGCAEKCTPPELAPAEEVQPMKETKPKAPRKAQPKNAFLD